jgi:predicted nucleic acid-binding protein
LFVTMLDRFASFGGVELDLRIRAIPLGGVVVITKSVRMKLMADTKVVSELMKPSPFALVIEWVRARTGSELFPTSITLAEILYGIAQLPGGRRKNLLCSTASDVFAPSRIRCLPFESSAATHYADVV